MNTLLLKSFTLAAVAATMIPVTGQARTKMSFDQAVQVCTDRAVQFGRQPYGRYAGEPPENRVQTEYRACVYANSGQYPTAKVQYRDSILTLLKDAF